MHTRVGGTLVQRARVGIVTLSVHMTAVADSIVLADVRHTQLAGTKIAVRAVGDDPAAAGDRSMLTSGGVTTSVRGTWVPVVAVERGRAPA